MVRSTKESWLHSRPGQQDFLFFSGPLGVLGNRYRRIFPREQNVWGVRLLNRSRGMSRMITTIPCLRGMHTDNIIFKLFISYQRNAQNFFIRIMLHSSTCFEQHYAHHQEVKFYVYIIWYRHSVWVDVVAVQYTGWKSSLSTCVLHGHHVHS